MRKGIGILVVVLCAACDRGPSAPAGGLTDREFVEVYVALRNAHTTARTPEEFARLEEEILRKAGATRESMKQFVEAHSGDLGYMATVWDSIRSQLDRTPFVEKPR
jgi:hypothetical protein